MMVIRMGIGRGIWVLRVRLLGGSDRIVGMTF